MFYMAVNRIKPNAEVVLVAKNIPPHIDWVQALIADGVIVQGGKWGESAGMVIVRADSLQQARQIIEQDPLSICGQFDFEIAQFFPNVEFAGYPIDEGD